MIKTTDIEFKVMELGAAGLQEQPFRIHGKPLVYFSYAQQQAAHEFLADICKKPRGLGLFLGPTLSGKTTTLRWFAETRGNDAEIAIIDGSGLNTTALLEAILGQYGYRLDLGCVNELLNMLKVFAMQRAASGHAPLLIIENAHALNASALRVVSELSQLNVRQQSAFRLVLASDRPIDAIINAPAMEAVKNRLNGEFNFGPLSEGETTDYLYAKMRGGGCFDPENVIPDDVCDEFHRASGGWPGILDRLILLALARAPHCPLTKEHVEHPVLEDYHKPPAVREATTNKAIDHRLPRLVLTQNGRTLQDLSIERDRVIIGRSELNDLQVDSKFISRHHAMLIRSGSTTFLMDLNSTNGTFVNSRRVSNQVMMNDDVITLGNHKIKFIHAEAKDIGNMVAPDFSDTVIMKSMEDMRRMLAQENTQSMPVPKLPKSAGADSD